LESEEATRRYSIKGSEWKTDKSGKIILESEQIFTTSKDSDEPILSETWQIEIPAKQKEYYQFDLISTQSCATTILY
jgi:hypothetical protein